MSCTTCQKSKAPLNCGICENSVCKSCVQYVDEDSFSFMPEIPEILTKGTYCMQCYDAQIAATVEDYKQTMEKAKEMRVFFKAQSKETRLIRSLADVVEVKGCADRDETILRLAFKAVLGNYNSIINVDVDYEKVRTGSYKTHIWHGVALPANVEDKRLILDRTNWNSPN